MINHRFSSLILIALLLTACAPATSTEVFVPSPQLELSATLSPVPDSATPGVDLTATHTLELLSATPPVDAQPIATSRGSELHATDPTTVSLASGGLHFVEFFRFT